MRGNFSFIIDKEIFNSFSSDCIEAEQSILVRRALELAVKWVDSFDESLNVPYQHNLSRLIHDNNFVYTIDSGLLPLLKYIVKLGNVAIHINAVIKREEAILALHNLHQFVS